MSAPERYRVTLACGHTMEWSLRPTRPQEKTLCWTCKKWGEITDIAPEPPGLRDWWTRLLARLPGLQKMVDRIHGPWRG